MVDNTQNSPSASPIISMTSAASGSGLKLNQSQNHNSFNIIAPVKLNRNNFLLWKSTILPVIRGNRLEGSINGSKPCPEPTIQTQEGLVPNPKFEEWQVTNQLLLGWLYSSISVEVAAQLVNCSTSKELWSSTEKMVGAATKAKILWYKSELQKMRKASLKMKEYLSKMKSLESSASR